MSEMPFLIIKQKCFAISYVSEIDKSYLKVSTIIRYVHFSCVSTEDPELKVKLATWDGIMGTGFVFFLSRLAKVPMLRVDKMLAGAWLNSGVFMKS